MDENYLRTMLKEKGWFKKDFIIDQIIEHVTTHNKYKQADLRNNRKALLNKAFKESNYLIKTLSQLEREHPECYSELEEKIRLRRLLENSFNNSSSESIADMLDLIKTTIRHRVNSFKSSPTANMVKRQPNGNTEIYYTNNNSINFKIIFELERIWETCTNLPIKKSSDSEFMVFLSLCLRGSEDKSDDVKKEFGRFRQKANAWGQKREK